MAFDPTKYLIRKERIVSVRYNSALLEVQRSFLKFLRGPKKKSNDDAIHEWATGSSMPIAKVSQEELPQVIDTASKNTVRDLSGTVGVLGTATQTGSVATAVFQFGISTDEVTAYMQDDIGKLIVGLDATTENEVRRLIQNAIKDGKSYSDLAKEIEAEAPWVFSETRAKLIATQEVGKAYSWADYQTAKKYQTEGRVIVRWHTSGDDRVRATHRRNAMDGWIDLDTPFVGTGETYPREKEIRCRCWMEKKIL